MFIFYHYTILAINIVFCILLSICICWYMQCIYYSVFLLYLYKNYFLIVKIFFWFYHPNHYFIGIFTCFLVTFLLFFIYIVDLFLKGKTLGQLKYKSNRTAVSKPWCIRCSRRPTGEETRSGILFIYILLICNVIYNFLWTY